MIKILIYLIMLLVTLKLTNSILINNLPQYCSRSGTWVSCENLNFGVFDDVEFDRSNKIKGHQFLIKNSNFSTLPRNTIKVLDTAEWLYVKNCSLKTLNKWNFESGDLLRRLSILENNIPKLSNEVFVYLMNLEYLDLESNNLNEIESKAFTGLYKLKSLFLEKNEIQKIPTNLFSHLTFLNIVNLNDNEISYIDQNMFKSNAQLGTLFLRNNKLVIIDKNIVNNPLALDYIKGHNTLKDWRVTGTIFLSNLKAVKKFDISGNFFPHISIDAFSDMMNLIELNISNNNMNFIEFGSLSHQTILDTLDISMNNISKFDVDLLLSMKSLANLYLHGNRLSSFDHLKFYTNHNRLKSITLGGNLWNCSYQDTMFDYFTMKNVTFSHIANETRNILMACSNTSNNTDLIPITPSSPTIIPDAYPPDRNTVISNNMNNMRNDIKEQFDKIESLLVKISNDLASGKLTDQAILIELGKSLITNFGYINASLDVMLKNNITDEVFRILNKLTMNENPETFEQRITQFTRTFLDDENNSTLKTIENLKLSIEENSSKPYVIVIFVLLIILTIGFSFVIISKQRHKFLRNEMTRKRLSEQTEILNESYIA